MHSGEKEKKCHFGQGRFPQTTSIPDQSHCFVLLCMTWGQSEGLTCEEVGRLLPGAPVNVWCADGRRLGQTQLGAAETDRPSCCNRSKPRLPFPPSLRAMLHILQTSVPLE